MISEDDIRSRITALESEYAKARDSLVALDARRNEIATAAVKLEGKLEELRSFLPPVKRDGLRRIGDHGEVHRG